MSEFFFFLLLYSTWLQHVHFPLCMPYINELVLPILEQIVNNIMHDVPGVFSSEYFSKNTLVQGFTICFQSLLLHKTHKLFSPVLYWKRYLGFWATTKRLITLLPTSQLIGCRSVTIHHNHFNSASCWPDHLDTCCTPFAFFSPLI